MSCPNASNVNVVSMPPPSGCTPVEGCPNGEPVQVTGPDGNPVDVNIVSGGGGTVDQGNPNAGGALSWPVIPEVVSYLGGFSQVKDGPAAENDATLQGTVAVVPLMLDVNSGLWQITYSARTFGTNDTGHHFGTSAKQLIREGSFGSAIYDQERTPFVQNTVQAVAAGNTALWTPTAGKSFRLMRYMVAVTGDAATAGGAVVTISLNDGGAAIGQDHDVFCPGAALAAGGLYTSPWIDLGNGILSAAVNNVLNVNLSAALTAGNVRVICCGTEE